MLPLTIVKFLYTQSHISDYLMFTVVSVSSLEVYTNKWNRRAIRKFVSFELSLYTMYMKTLHAWVGGAEKQGDVENIIDWPINQLGLTCYKYP